MTYMPTYQVPPDLIVKSDAEPQFKLYFRNFMDGFIQVYQEPSVSQTLLNFLFTQAQRFAEEVNKAEKETLKPFDGKDKQALYFEAGYFLCRVYLEYPAIQFSDILAQFKFVVMPPSHIQFDLISHKGTQTEPPAQLTTNLNKGYRSNHIRASTFLFYNKLDSSLQGLFLRVGFNDDYLIRKGYIKPREA